MATRFLKLFVGVGIVAAVLVASGSSGNSVRNGGTIVFGSASDPVVLDGALVSDGESLRPINQMFEASGGTLEGFYFAFGESDAYVFGELPGNEAATAVALSVNQGGGATVKTVVLLTPEEVDAAAKASVEYTPPGG